MFQSELLETLLQDPKFQDILTIISIAFVAKLCYLLHWWSGTFNIELDQKCNQLNTYNSRWPIMSNQVMKI